MKYEYLQFVSRGEIAIHEGTWSSSQSGGALMSDPREISPALMNALVEPMHERLDTAVRDYLRAHPESRVVRNRTHLYGMTLRV